MTKIKHLAFNTLNSSSQNNVNVSFVVRHFTLGTFSINEISTGSFRHEVAFKHLTRIGHFMRTTFCVILLMFCSWLRRFATIITSCCRSRPINAPFWCLQKALFNWVRKSLILTLVFKKVFWFIDDIDLFVRVLVVDIIDMPLAFVQKHPSHIVDISLFRLLLDFDRNLGVLWENVAQ